LLGWIQSVDIRLKGKFTEINQCGDVHTYRCYDGFDIEGKFSGFKIDSMIVAEVADAYQTGVFNNICINAIMGRKGSNSMQRIAIGGVVVEELPLAVFTKKEPIEEEISFKASDFEIQESAFANLIKG